MRRLGSSLPGRTPGAASRFFAVALSAAVGTGVAVVVAATPAHAEQVVVADPADDVADDQGRLIGTSPGDLESVSVEFDVDTTRIDLTLYDFIPMDAPAWSPGRTAIVVLLGSSDAPMSVPQFQLEFLPSLEGPRVPELRGPAGPGGPGPVVCTPEFSADDATRSYSFEFADSCLGDLESFYVEPYFVYGACDPACPLVSDSTPPTLVRRGPVPSPTAPPTTVTPPPTVPSFWDVPAGSTHFADVEAAVRAGVVQGCAPGWFCPSAPTTRAQTATLLARAMDRVPSSSDYFDDDDASVHEGAIDAMADLGVVSGCTATTFCPDAPTTRGQLASLLARALDLPPATSDAFGDDDASVHEDAIDRVAAAGLVGGFADGTFRPDDAVTRAQAASIIARAFQLPGHS